MPEQEFSSTELYDAWTVLSLKDKLEGFKLLAPEERERFFKQLSARDEANLLEAFPPGERRFWIRLLAPEDVADLIQETARLASIHISDPRYGSEGNPHFGLVAGCPA